MALVAARRVTFNRMMQLWCGSANMGASRATGGSVDYAALRSAPGTTSTGPSIPAWQYMAASAWSEL